MDKEDIREEAEDMEGDIKVVEAVVGCRELAGELVEVEEEVDTAEEEEEEDTDMLCLHCFPLNICTSFRIFPKIFILF